MLMLLRSTKKQGREVYLYDPIGADREGNEIHLLDIMESKEEDVAALMDTAEHIQKLPACMEKVLNDREKEILRKRYGLDRGEEITQREIARELGISRSYSAVIIGIKLVIASGFFLNFGYTRVKHELVLFNTSSDCRQNGSRCHVREPFFYPFPVFQFKFYAG